MLRNIGHHLRRFGDVKCICNKKRLFKADRSKCEKDLLCQGRTIFINLPSTEIEVRIWNNIYFQVFWYLDCVHFAVRCIHDGIFISFSFFFFYPFL